MNFGPSRARFLGAWSILESAFTSGLRMLPVFSGVVLLTAVLAYALYGAVADPRPPQEASAQPAQAPQVVQVVSTPPGGWPTPGPFPFYIFLLCDGETVASAIYSGIVYYDSVTLYAGRDRDLILDVLQGEPTLFPAQSMVSSSDCVKRTFGVANS